MTVWVAVEWVLLGFEPVEMQLVEERDIKKLKVGLPLVVNHDRVVQSNQVWHTFDDVLTGIGAFRAWVFENGQKFQTFDLANRIQLLDPDYLVCIE